MAGWVAGDLPAPATQGTIPYAHQASHTMSVWLAGWLGQPGLSAHVGSPTIALADQTSQVRYCLSAQPFGLPPLVMNDCRDKQVGEVGPWASTAQHTLPDVVCNSSRTLSTMFDNAA